VNEIVNPPEAGEMTTSFSIRAAASVSEILLPGDEYSPNRAISPSTRSRVSTCDLSSISLGPVKSGDGRITSAGGATARTVADEVNLGGTTRASSKPAAAPKSTGTSAHFHLRRQTPRNSAGDNCR